MKAEYKMLGGFPDARTAADGSVSCSLVIAMLKDFPPAIIPGVSAGPFAERAVATWMEVEGAATLILRNCLWELNYQ